MAKKGYKFTNKIHSKKAIMSAAFGVLSGTSLIVLIYLAYTKKGDVPVNYGIAVILALVFAIIGAVLGVLAVQEKDKYKFFSILGIVTNFLALAGVSGILFAGANL